MRNRSMAESWGLRFDRSAEVAGMFSPVECAHCGSVYDLGKVTVTARYSDCSVWTTPCCRRRGVDDRPPWGGMVRHYWELDSNGNRKDRR